MVGRSLVPRIGTHFWPSIGILIGGLAITAAWLRASLIDLNFFFISDTLYLPSLYRDLFTEGNCIWEWQLNPAPNFFPDMGLYFLLQAVWGDLRLATCTFSIVQFALVGLLLWALAQESGLVRSNEAIGLGLLLMALVPLVGWWAGDFGLAFQSLVNSYHLGAFVNTLICTWLLHRVIFSRRLVHSILLATVVLLAAASDMLFWLMFVVPALVATACLTLWPGFRASAVRTIILLMACTGLAHWGLAALDEAFPMRIAEPNAIMDIAAIGSSWDQLVEILRVYLSGKPLSIWVTLVPLVITAWMTLSCVQLPAKWSGPERPLEPVAIKRLFFRTLLLLFFPIVFFAPVLNGTFGGGDALRYNFAVFLAAPFVLGAWAGDRSGTRGTPLTAALALVIGIPCLFKCVTADHRRLTDFVPDRVVAVDQMAASLGLRNGIANYWDAKVITLFSETGLTVLPVHTDLTMYLHVNREFMFYRSAGEDPIVFDFVVQHEELQPAHAADILGDPIAEVNEGTDKLMVFRPWTFDPFTRRPRPFLPAR